MEMNTFIDGGHAFPGVIGIPLPVPIFEGFPKIPRYRREVVITEKLDGTNAQIYITEDGRLFPGSRNRWIDTTADGVPFFGTGATSDNFGFAKWCSENVAELMKLGPGRHFGEWYGCGIQRGYGLQEKRWALFNSARWREDNPPPACCSVVPILYRGNMDETKLAETLQALRDRGSVAAPGFMDPEGIVVYHCASRGYYKVTCKNDESSKGSQE